MNKLFRPKKKLINKLFNFKMDIYKNYKNEGIMASSLQSYLFFINIFKNKNKMRNVEEDNG